MSRQDDSLPLWFVLLVTTPFVIGAALWGEFIYGDWKCGFAECRMIVENEE